MMFPTRSFSALIVALGLSACVSAAPPASRGALVQQPGLSAGMSQSSGSVEAAPAGTVYLQAQYDVEGITIVVPRTLKVSEANSFKPRADIVWHGEPAGDRYQQVATIFNEAMHVGTDSMQGDRKVDIEVVVTRFHALTEKTRYTIGGVHEMRFTLTVRDDATGSVIDGPREVVADVRASGGSQAIAEDQAGRTQRVVTVERLAQVIRRELSAPVSQEQLVTRMAPPPVIITE